MCKLTQVLGDHARMIHDNLAPSEKEDIWRAEGFICTFDQLLAQTKHSISGRQLQELTACSLESAKEIRSFKLGIICRQVAEEIKVGLPPTFINHMVNEVEQYLHILGCALTDKTVPAFHPVYHHVLWLLDAAGHAEGLAGDLDMVEDDLKERSRQFATTFEDLYLKAVEFKGYLRTGISSFPALSRLNCQAASEIELFRDFLCRLRELVKTKMVLGTITPLIPDHMMREECYYLTKLAEVTGLAKPNCDATRPRQE